MRIVILGAGRVGSKTARELVLEGNDVIIVDQNAEVLMELSQKLEISTTLGHAAHPDVLERAGVRGADLLLACTNSDEINLVACEMGHHNFGVRSSIARIRAYEYAGYLKHRDAPTSSGHRHEFIVQPESLVTEFIEELVKQPGVRQVLHFANRTLSLVAMKSHKNISVKQLCEDAHRDSLLDLPICVAAIYRGEVSQDDIDQDTEIQKNDLVFLLTPSEQIESLVKQLRHAYFPYRKIAIAGGGRIGCELARRLEQTEIRRNIKIIEFSPRRCQEIANQLKRSVVIQGDACNIELMQEENLADCDLFCAVMNSDELNILSAMMAKKVGTPKVMALISNSAYTDLVQDSSINVLISPSTITTGAILQHIRSGDVLRVHSLRDGRSEALEVVAHKGKDGVVGRRPQDIRLPKGARICAVVRDGAMLDNLMDTELQEGDHLILFLADKEHLDAVEKLFRPQN